MPEPFIKPVIFRAWDNWRRAKKAPISRDRQKSLSPIITSLLCTRHTSWQTTASNWNRIAPRRHGGEMERHHIYFLMSPYFYFLFMWGTYSGGAGYIRESIKEKLYLVLSLNSARVQVTMSWIEKGKKGCRFTDIRLRGMAEKNGLLLGFMFTPLTN